MNATVAIVLAILLCLFFWCKDKNEEFEKEELKEKQRLEKELEEQKLLIQKLEREIVQKDNFENTKTELKVRNKVAEEHKQTRKAVSKSEVYLDDKQQKKSAKVTKSPSENSVKKKPCDNVVSFQKEKNNKHREKKQTKNIAN